MAEAEDTKSSNKILKILKDKHNNTNLKLPREVSFEYSENEKSLSIGLTKLAVSRNMQTDGSAFEGWALVLYEALHGNDELPVEKIELNWATPDNTTWLSDTKKKGDGSPANKVGVNRFHYQRFLYRVERFAAKFSKWFLFSPEKKKETMDNSDVLVKAKNGSKLFLNQIKKAREANEKQLAAIENRELREVILEMELASKGGRTARSEKFWRGFDLLILERQIPTALFFDSVTAHTRIFNGGASAIDLIGISKNLTTAKIFELKLDNNAKVGILSELFFYTCVIEDLLDGNFGFDENNKPHDSSIEFYNALIKCTKIESHFLSPRNSHALLTENTMLILNEGFEKTRDKLVENVRFSIETLDSDEGISK